MGNKLGEHIKEFRKTHNLSLRDFAKMANVSHTHIDSIEKGVDFRTGKPVRITNETIQKLAYALGENEAYLFNLSLGKDEPNQKTEPAPQNESEELELTQKELELINILRRTPPAQQEAVLNLLLSFSKEKE